MSDSRNTIWSFYVDNMTQHVRFAVDILRQRELWKGSGNSLFATPGDLEKCPMPSQEALAQYLQSYPELPRLTVVKQSIASILYAISPHRVSLQLAFYRYRSDFLGSGHKKPGMRSALAGICVLVGLSSGSSSGGSDGESAGELPTPSRIPSVTENDREGQ